MSEPIWEAASRLKSYAITTRSDSGVKITKVDGYDITDALVKFVGCIESVLGINEIPKLF